MVMKKNYFAFVCAICALTLFSCQKEDNTPEEEAPVVPAEEEVIPEGYTQLTLSAVSDETKTTLDGTAVKWAAGDQIKVYCSDESAYDFELVGEGGSATGDFTGLVPSGKTALYAVYPKDLYSSVSSSTVNVTIPAAQEGTFGKGNIAVAKVDGEHNMAFKNVNAFVGFTVGADITKVVVSSVGGEDLSGTLAVDCSGENPAAGALSDGGPSITVTFPVSTGGTYYVAIAPGITHSKGLLLTWYNGTTVTGTYWLNKAIATVANNVYNMGDVSATGEYYVTVDGGTSVKNGMSWATAWSASQFWSKIHPGGTDAQMDNAKLANINGATFHFAAGTYKWGADAAININDGTFGTVSFTIKGGYNASTGARDIVNNVTTFTGDEDGDGTGDHRILSLAGDMNVEFDGVNFVKGLVAGNGGGVKISAGDWAFTDCSFSNNSALNGGAIYIDGGTIALDGCTLSSNTATTTDDQFGGGAIFMRGGAVVTIEDSDFTSNSTTSCGGAISAWPDDGDPDTDDDDANSNSLIISNNCEFSANHASKWAGAILYKVKGSMTVSDSSFSENYADGDGGAIEADNSNATFSFTSVSFTGNHADGDNGGAMWASDGTYTLTNCNFVGNYSSPNSKDDNKGGGAIYVEKGNMTITGGVFGGDNVADGNTTTGGDGGAICLKNASIGLYLDGVSFKNNSASRVRVSSKYYHGYGGALYLASTKNSDWNSHKATFIKNCIFESCNAYYGGAISTHTGSLGFVRISGGSFTDCCSSDMGGAIYIRSSGGDNKEFEFVDNNNIGTVFQGNHSSEKNGGAVAIDEASTVRVFRASFNGNYARSGGAIYAKSTGNKLFIDESSFDANYITASYGCVMNIQNNYFVMHNSSVRGSYASPSQTDENGSWIDFDAIQGCTSISNCSIIGDASSSALVWACNGSWTNYFTNNIITSSASSTNSIYSDGSTLNLSYNHYYSASSFTDNGGNVSAVLSSNIDNLSWSNTGSPSYYWKWDGTFDSVAPSKTNKTAVTSRVTTASSAFMTWSGSDFNKDQRGTGRGDGDWWPGAYQSN